MEGQVLDRGQPGLPADECHRPSRATPPEDIASSARRGLALDLMRNSVRSPLGGSPGRDGEVRDAWIFGKSSSSWSK